MSLIYHKYFLLFYLIKTFTYSNSLDYGKNFDELCFNYEQNYNTSNISNFTEMIKMNFELFLCEMYTNMFKNLTFDQVFGNVKDIDICVESITKSFRNDSDFFYKYLLYSGSSLNKIGNEKKCVKNNLTYILVEMNSNLDTINTILKYYIEEGAKNTIKINNEVQFFELNGFIENNKFYLGLCLWEKCTNFYEKFFQDENDTLKSYLGENGYMADNWTFYIHKERNSEYNYSMIISIILISFITSVRLFLCLSRYCTEKNKRKEENLYGSHTLATSPNNIQLYKQNIANQEDLSYDNSDIIKDSYNIIDEKNEKDQYDDLNKAKYISNESNIRSTRRSIIKTEKTQAEKFLEQYEYINFDNLYQLETKSFNSKKLEAICGLKFFLLFFISFYNVYTTFYIVKWNTPGSISFYKSLLHILLAKLSKMSFRIWIFFDGFQWCFKLLSYIDKLKNDNVKFKHIMIFNINLIEKIIVFIMIFFIFIYQMQYIGDAFFLTSSFYKHIQQFTEIKCYKNPLYILILPILGFTEKIGHYHKCFNFIYILVNEFYTIIICSILFFLFFKFRSKKLEYFFLFLFFISIIMIYVFIQYYAIKGDDVPYIKRYVLGEDYSLKCIPFLFHYFFIGCISGIIYYYSTLMNLNFEKYNIFENCYKFMYQFIKISNVLRHILGFFCLFLIFAICSYYPLLFEFGFMENFLFAKYIGIQEKLIISFENIIQILLFMFFFFDIILSSDIFTKSFLSNDIFILFERCSLVFLIISEPIVFLFETLMYLDGIFWNTENIIFLSIICFLITLIISSLLVFFIQLPVRLITKKKARECLDNFEEENKIKEL